MRILTDEELELFLNKLKKFIGVNIKLLIAQEDKENPWVFRMVAKRVHYLPEALLKQSSVFGKKELLHAGVCFGQFSKTN